MKAFTDKCRKTKVAELQVAGCARNSPYSILQKGFLPKRNPQLSLGYVFCFVSVFYLYIVYILLYMYIYLYIIYNIIKNKKKNPSIGLHIHRRKNGCTPKVAGCVFRKNRLYIMLWIGFWAQPSTCNLATRLRFCFWFLVHICVVPSSSSAMFLVSERV